MVLLLAARHSDQFVSGGYLCWLVVWNMNFMTFHILGMSSSQLTFLFFKGVTTNQSRFVQEGMKSHEIMINHLGLGLYQPISGSSPGELPPEGTSQYAGFRGWFRGWFKKIEHAHTHTRAPFLTHNSEYHRISKKTSANIKHVNMLIETRDIIKSQVLECLYPKAAIQ